MEGRRCDSTFRLHVKTMYSLCSNKFSERMWDTSAHGISWQKLGSSARWPLVHFISGTLKCEIRNYRKRKWPHVDATGVMWRIPMEHIWCLPRIRINQSHFFLLYAVRTLQEYTHTLTDNRHFDRIDGTRYLHAHHWESVECILELARPFSIDTRFLADSSNNEKVSEIVFFHQY